MSLVKFYNPHYDVTRNLVDDLFGDFFDNNYHNNYVRYCASNPATNVLENEKNFKLEILLPGFSKEDVVLNCKDKVLTVKAEKKETKSSEEYKYEHREFEALAFEKEYRLPKTVDIDRISASFENGILTLLIPKKEKEQEKAPLKIEIA